MARPSPCGVDHLGETIAVHRSEHRSEADTAHAAEDDVEGHVDLDAAARRDDDADDLVDDVDALEHVDGGLIVVLIGTQRGTGFPLRR